MLCINQDKDVSVRTTQIVCSPPLSNLLKCPIQCKKAGQLKGKLTVNSILNVLSGHTGTLCMEIK